jgi:hypothetical protein
MKSLIYVGFFFLARVVWANAARNGCPPNTALSCSISQTIDLALFQMSFVRCDYRCSNGGVCDM